MEGHKRIFVEIDGRPMRFYLRPCAQRAHIRHLVETGGGQMTDLGPGVHHLAPPDSINMRETAISTKFVEDSSAQGRLVPLENYRMGNQPAAEANRRSGVSDNDGWITSNGPRSGTNAAAAAPVSSVFRDGRRGGRMAYTKWEDRDIFQFLVDQRNGEHKQGGDNLYRKMSTKVLGRTWQSLKERYKKKLREYYQDLLDAGWVIVIYEDGPVKFSLVDGKVECDQTEPDQVAAVVRPIRRQQAVGDDIEDFDATPDRPRPQPQAEEEAPSTTTDAVDTQNQRGFYPPLMNPSEPEQRVPTRTAVEKTNERRKENDNTRGDEPKEQGQGDDGGGGGWGREPQRGTDTARDMDVDSVSAHSQGDSESQSPAPLHTSQDVHRVGLVLSALQQLCDPPVSVEVVIAALMATSGNIEDTCYFLKNKRPRDGTVFWTYEMDRPLDGVDAVAIATHIQDLGESEVNTRITFLET